MSTLYRLARIKAEARRQREEREHAEHMRLMEQQRRGDALRRQFHEWNIGYFHDARIELALVSPQSAGVHFNGYFNNQHSFRFSSKWMSPCGLLLDEIRGHVSK